MIASALTVAAALLGIASALLFAIRARDAERAAAALGDRLTSALREAERLRTLSRREASDRAQERDRLVRRAMYAEATAREWSDRAASAESAKERARRELAVPAFEAAWAGACRVAKRERNKQRRFELGNERARAIQETSRREAEAARLADGVKPEINLTIKREWLDTILYRGKREEYRAADNPQCLRLWRECESVGHFPLRPIVAVLRAGYSMDSRAAAVLVNIIARREGFRSRLCDGSVHRKPPCEHWGEPREEPHFALGLQRVLTGGSYSFIRDWVATPDAERAVAVARVEGADHA